METEYLYSMINICDLKIGDTIIADNNTYMYVYVGNDLWEKKIIPFRTEIPTLRTALSYNETEKLSITKCCYSCRYFAECKFSAPAGWCGKHRCKQVNTDAYSVCDDYDNKPTFEI